MEKCGWQAGEGKKLPSRPFSPPRRWPTPTSIFNIDMLHLGKINYQLSIIILSYRWCPGELVPRDGDLPDGADEAQQHLGLHRRRHQGQRRLDSGRVRVSLLMGVDASFHQIIMIRCQYSKYLILEIHFMCAVQIYRPPPAPFLCENFPAKLLSVLILRRIANLKSGNLESWSCWWEPAMSDEVTSTILLQMTKDLNIWSSPRRWG